VLALVAAVAAVHAIPLNGVTDAAIARAPDVQIAALEMRDTEPIAETAPGWRRATPTADVATPPPWRRATPIAETAPGWRRETPIADVATPPPWRRAILVATPPGWKRDEDTAPTAVVATPPGWKRDEDTVPTAAVATPPGW